MTVTMTAPGPGSILRPCPAHPIPRCLRRWRRRFSAEYKLAILREADACTEPGQIGALLRRERLYPLTWSIGAANARPERSRPWRASAAQPADQPGRGRAAAAAASASPSGWRRRRRSSRSREKSRAAGDPARPGQRRRAERELVTAVDGRARPWRRPGLPGAGDLPGDAVPAPAAAGVNCEAVSRPPAAGTVRR